MRPKTLAGAAAPVLLGAGMAWHDKFGPLLDSYSEARVRQGFDAWDTYVQYSCMQFAIPALLCLAFALVMQVDANFVNDYLDFKKGTDRADRLGPERACAQGWITPRAMLVGIIITTVLGCLIGCTIMLWHLQWELLLVGVLCVLACFLYTVCLSYMGLGDILVLLFFGIVPVCFTYYVITGGRWTPSLIIASVAMGCATDCLLMVNNHRDRMQDRVSGKRTIVVKLMNALGDHHGTQMSLALYLALGVIAAALGAYSLHLLNNIKAGAIILSTMIYVCLHISTFCKMCRLDGRDLNRVLGATARNIVFFGLALTLAMFAVERAPNLHF